MPMPMKASAGIISAASSGTLFSNIAKMAGTPVTVANTYPCDSSARITALGLARHIVLVWLVLMLNKVPYFS
jgi:hypothetical protein